MVANLETKVKKCYESAPFPDNLRKAKSFKKELERTVSWIKLNLDFLSHDLTSSYKPKVILCAGCGTGEEAIALSKIFPDSKITAIDISKPSLKIALQNIKKAKVKNIYLRQLSIIEDLPKLKRKYDFIYSAGVIHHLSNPKQGFDNLVSKLKPKSKLVIMLYNSYGLFFYKLQLTILDILGGTTESTRIFWLKVLQLGSGKEKAEIYDSYINPQVKTFTIEQIMVWAKERKLNLEGVVPPLSAQRLVEYATGGKRYVFRRKKILTLVLGLSLLLFRSKNAENTRGKINLSRNKTFIYQMLFLFLGKGECQYILTNSSSSQ